MFPFEMGLGIYPQSLMDSLYSISQKNKGQYFKLQLKESLKDAIYTYKTAKASQNARASMKKSG